MRDKLIENKQPNDGGTQAALSVSKIQRKDARREDAKINIFSFSLRLRGMASLR